MQPRSTLFVLFLFGGAALLGAQSAKLLKDINRQPKLASSQPGPMVAQEWLGRPTFSALGTRVLVAAETPKTGREIFVVDVATGKGQLLRDIRPGDGSSWPASVRVTRNGKAAFFVANDGKTGSELWVTDGTTAGTRLVKDIHSGLRSSNPTEIVAFGAGSVIFSAWTLATGRELYVSDGTAKGTTLLRDIGPGATSSTPLWLRCTRDGKQVFFQAKTSAAGQELWRSDGTKAGTRLVKDLQSGSGSSLPTHMTPLGSSRMLFNAHGKWRVMDLWVSDGTSAGTKSIFAAGDYSLKDAIPFGNRVLLSRVALVRPFAHITDGTKKGTVQLISGCYEGMGSPHIDTAGKRIYWHSTWNCSLQLIVSDGTFAGTRRMHPGIRLSAPASILELGGKLYFEGQDVTLGTGKELSVSDGTTAGTRTVQDLWPGKNNGRARYLTRIDARRAVFVGNDGKTGTELWILESGKAPRRVDLYQPKLALTQHSVPVFWFRYGQRVLFGADDGIAGRQTWQTDGTSINTVPSTNRHPLFHSSKATVTVESAELHGKHLFIGSTAATGRELWISDGTQAGTHLLKDLRKGPQSSWIRNMTTVGNKVYFSTDAGGGGQEPWVSDGTAKGTYRLAEIATGIIGSWPAGFSGLGDRVVFRAWSQAHGYEPYLTDGTAAGTRLLKDIIPGTSSSYGGWGVMMDGKVYFAASGPGTGSELWVTDFTKAGTRIAVDLVPGVAGSDPWVLGARNGRLYFVVTMPASKGYSLWVTNGLAAGTRLFMGHKGRPAIREPRIPIGSRRVTFTTQDASRGLEPVVTDGTAAGTRILEIVPGPVGGLPTRANGYIEWITLGSRLLIPGSHPVYGREIFVHDNGATAEPVGTSAGSTWLQGSDPIQGQSATLTGGTRLGRALHITLVGVPSPQATPLGRAGSLHLDLARPILFLGTDQGTRFQRSVPVPGTPSLRGLQLMVQTLTFDASNLVGTMELSNGLHWVLGL